MSSVLSAYQDCIQTLTLCNPTKKNAMTGVMYRQLTQLLQQAQQDPDVLVVVLTGAEGNFCSGHDLKEFQSKELSEQDAISFLQTLNGFSKPLVAVVEGAVVGVGATLLLHCDLVISAEQTYFHFPFTQLGLVPEAASSLLLPLRVGYAKAAEWLMLAEPFNAHQALLTGFINKLVPGAELKEQALKVASALAMRPPKSLQATKALLKAPHQQLTQQSMHRELELFQKLLRSPECQQSIDAFFAHPSS